jgi:excisionase family DNA binding protein
MSIVIDKKDQQMAQASLDTLKSRVKLPKGKTVRIRIGEVELSVPRSVFSLFSDILSNFAEGKAVSILAAEEEITTQQAADMLRVSRPFIVKLLDGGKIPSTKVGRHRRVLVKDVRAYEERQQENRQKQLAFLSSQAQELNMGY